MKWVSVFVRMHFKHTGIIGMVCANCHLRLKQKPCQAEAPEHKLVYNVMNYPCLCSICWGNHSPQHTSILPACSMSTFDRRSITLTSSGSIPCSSDTHKHKHHKATSRGHSLSETAITGPAMQKHHFVTCTHIVTNNFMQTSGYALMPNRTKYNKSLF